MKSFSLGFFLCFFALYAAAGLAGQALPGPVGFVNDFAGVMRQEDIEATEKLVAAIQQRTGAEIAVVTVQSFAPFGSLDEFSIALMENWGVGKKGEDTGILLILAVSERKVRIEVGYGLEGAIPDSAAGRILDTAVIPVLQAGNFSGGMASGARSIAAIIASEKGIDPAEFNLKNTALESEQNDAMAALLPFLIFLAIVIFIIVISKKTGRRFGSGRFGGFGGSGFGGGSRGGGFGGFGGGRFGGGGASRGF